MPMSTNDLIVALTVSIAQNGPHTVAVVSYAGESTVFPGTDMISIVFPSTDRLTSAQHEDLLTYTPAVGENHVTSAFNWGATIHFLNVNGQIVLHGEPGRPARVDIDGEAHHYTMGYFDNNDSVSLIKSLMSNVKRSALPSAKDVGDRALTDVIEIMSMPVDLGGRLVTRNAVIKGALDLASREFNQIDRDLSELRVMTAAYIESVPLQAEVKYVVGKVEGAQ